MPLDNNHSSNLTARISALAELVGIAPTTPMEPHNDTGVTAAAPPLPTVDPFVQYREFDICSWSDSEEFDRATESLNSKLDLKGHLTLRNRHIRFLLVELARLEKERPSHYLGVRMDNNWWTHRTPSGFKTIYNPNKLTRRITRVIQALTKAGYLEYLRGFRDDYYTDTSTGRISRIRPTLKLIEECFRPFHLLDAQFKRHVESPVIVLKDGKKRPMWYSQTISEVRESTSIIKRYNTLLELTNIQLDTASATNISPNRKSVYRVFNGDFNSGGRFYGSWWQAISGDERKHILINGEPTIELDYEAQSVHMLYCLAGTKYDRARYGDAYLISALGDQNARQLVKKLIATGLNAKTTQGAWKAASGSFQKKGCLWEYEHVKHFEVYKKALKAVLKKHPIIEKYLYTGIGLTLMNKDSLVCETVIKRLTDQNIPVLTVHDSFIVQGRHKDILKSTMQQAYTLNGLEDALPLIRG